MNNKIKFILKTKTKTKKTKTKNKNKTRKKIHHKIKGGAAKLNNNNNDIIYVYNPIIDPKIAAYDLDIQLRIDKNKLWTDLTKEQQQMLLYRNPFKTYWEAELLKSFVNSMKWEELSKIDKNKIAASLFPGKHTDIQLKKMFNEYIIWTRYGLHHDGSNWKTNSRMLANRQRNFEYMNKLQNNNENGM